MARRRATPKPEPTEVDRREFRSRPTLPGPFGDDEPPFIGTYAEVMERATVDREGDMAPIVEYRVHGIGWVTYRKPVLVDELRRIGLAREKTYMVRSKATGEAREETRWEIDPEGQRMIHEAMRA